LAEHAAFALAGALNSLGVTRAAGTGSLANDIQALVIPDGMSPVVSGFGMAQHVLYNYPNGTSWTYEDDLSIDLSRDYDHNDTAVFTLAAAVPESSSWLMMILGFAGVGFMAYRRRNQGTALSAA
jgi:hypothetical protein